MNSEPSQPSVNQSDAIKNRAMKNKVVLALVLGFVALVWAITMIKMQHGG